MIPNASTVLRALQQKRGTGYVHADLPSANRIHSQVLVGAAGVLPESASVRTPLVEAKDQAATNSCVGNAAVQAFRIASIARGAACPDLGALFPYKLGRAVMGLDRLDEGMTFSALLTAVTRFGFASEALCPFGIARVNLNPTATAYHDGYDRRGVRAYAEIDPADTRSIRQALARKVPLIGAWQLDSYFGAMSGPTLVDLPSGGFIGSHAMVIEDYAADGTFGLLNHYGENWRDGGRCRFTERYVKSASSIIAFDLG